MPKPRRNSQNQLARRQAGSERPGSGAGCSLTEAAWRAVLNLPQLPNLRWLRLHNARLVDQQRRHRGYLRDQPEYVDTFTARVAAMDWDTQFIDPIPEAHGLGFRGRHAAAIACSR
jgi:hypothetical protein